jgi:hypothetical protein
MTENSVTVLGLGALTLVTGLVIMFALALA